MTVNPYIDRNDHSTTQDVYEDLVVESIQYYGLDMYYMRKTLDTSVEDYLFGDNKYSVFDTYHIIEMLPGDYSAGWQGDGMQWNNFGGALKVEDEMVLYVSRRRFQEVVTDGITSGDGKTSGDSTYDRPRMGDLIAGVMKPGNVFEITAVEDSFETDFFQFGSRYLWRVTIQLLKYDNIYFNTGIAEIDILNDIYASDTSGDIPDQVEYLADNEDIEEEADDNMDWCRDNPFGDI
jgi:hypothetical protein